MTERYAENSPRTRRVKDAQTIIGFLANRHTQPVFPAMSDHYRTDDERIVAEFETPEYHPSPTVVPAAQTGYDSEGNYHCPSLRTEHVVVERPVQLDGQWDL